MFAKPVKFKLIFAFKLTHDLPQIIFSSSLRKVNFSPPPPKKKEEWGERDVEYRMIQRQQDGLCSKTKNKQTNKPLILQTLEIQLKIPLFLAQMYIIMEGMEWRHRALKRPAI